jgi:tetratricopeptide (TPR) repeat protein
VDKSFEHPDWALVYWDDNSYLYLKRDGIHASVIKDDEYRSIKPLAPFTSFIRGLNDENIHDFEKELERNIRETNSSRAHLLMSLLHFENGKYEEAAQAASNVQTAALKTASYIARGDAYRELGNMELSLHYYRKALSRDEIPGVLFRAGVVSQLTGDNKQALKYFKRALELDSTLAYAYPKLIDTYLALGMEKKASEAMSRYQNLKQGQ